MLCVETTLYPDSAGSVSTACSQSGAASVVGGRGGCFVFEDEECRSQEEVQRRFILERGVHLEGPAVFHSVGRWQQQR
ncbi:unnamed protein product [Lampetra fluviatilis]